MRLVAYELLDEFCFADSSLAPDNNHLSAVFQPFLLKKSQLFSPVDEHGNLLLYYYTYKYYTHEYILSRTNLRKSSYRILK